MTSLNLAASAGATRPVAPVAADDAEQLPLRRALVLHLLPGLAGLAVFLLTAPLLAAAGFPALFAFYGPMSLTIVAAEAGFLVRERRRRRAAGDARPVIGFHGRLGAPAFAALAVGLVLLGLVATSLGGAVDGLLAGTLFAGLPGWWLVTDPTAITASPGTLLALTFAVGFVMNGLVGPIVEESYFRGYLLPRLSRFGRWAPVLNATLFSLYHFWQPWAFASRLAFVLPYAAAVQRTRDIRLGMVVHCTANILGMLLLVGLALR
jgi:hypothetical protein